MTRPRHNDEDSKVKKADASGIFLPRRHHAVGALLSGTPFVQHSILIDNTLRAE
jgi:hypothetical protein